MYGDKEIYAFQTVELLLYQAAQELSATIS